MMMMPSTSLLRLLPRLPLFARPTSTVSPLPRSSAAPALYRLPRNIRPYSTPAHAETPPNLDEGEQRIYAKLQARFPGDRVEVQDVSGGCGSFYAIVISSPKFKGMSMIKQHKLVNECLKDDIAGIHGLQLKTIAEE